MVVPKYPFPVVGGLERQAHELSKSLAARGHTITILSSRFDSTQTDDDVVEGIHVRRIPWSESKVRRFLVMPWRLFRVIARLRRELEVVHVHNITWFGAFTTIAAKLLGLPVIAKLPSYGSFGIESERARSFGWLRILLLRLCDSLVAMSRESLKEVEEIHFPIGRVLKTINGISLNNAPEPSARAGGSAKVRAIFVGRLSVEKGVEDLLHAWSLLRGRNAASAVLRIIGEGPLAADLQQLSRELGLDEVVTFTGYSTNVPEEMAAADLFVLPSHTEGNSNSILEAMRAALPIVATRVGGTPLQVGPEGLRFLFEPGDRAALAEALLALIEDRELRAAKGARMRTRVEERFSMDSIAAVYESAYDLLCAGRREDVGGINAELFAHGCAD